MIMGYSRLGKSRISIRERGAGVQVGVYFPVIKYHIQPAPGFMANRFGRPFIIFLQDG